MPKPTKASDNPQKHDLSKRRLLTGMTIQGIGKKGIPMAEGIRGEIEDVVDMGKGKYYVPVRVIGTGGLSTVYEANHVWMGRTKSTPLKEEKVAMKVIEFDFGEPGSDPMSATMMQQKRDEKYGIFEAELELASKLKHPNIVEILDFYELKDGRPFIIMELLEGRDLETIREKKCEKGQLFSWTELKPLIIPVCKALTAAHEYRENGEKKPIIHRDIKPLNIFVAHMEVEEKGKKITKQVVKVLDFGLAKVVEDKGEATETDKEIHGTPAFMSPEQAQGINVDHRTDIYSLGVVMYQLLSGVPPFIWNPPLQKEGESKEQYALRWTDAWNGFWSQVFNDRPTPLRDIGVDIPEEVDGIILKCLEKKPENRFQSAEELMNAIEEANGLVNESPNVIVDPELLIHRGGDLATADTAQATPPDSIERNEVTKAPGEGLADANRHEKTEIVRIRNSQKMTQVRGLPKRNTLAKYFVYGAIGVLVAGGAVGTGYVMLDDNEAQRVESRIERPARVAGKERDAQPAKAAEPITEPLQVDSGVMDTVEEEREHAITIKTNVRGVEVILGEDVLCTTSGAEKACSIDYYEGSEPVELTFRRPGFRDAKQSFVPDHAQTLEVRLQRERPAKRPGTRPGRPNGRGPVIISVD